MAMDFHRYVRDHLPPLAIAREPEIVDELAQHLSDLYQEALSNGATADVALARAVAALPPESGELGRDIERASRTLPGLIADWWRASSVEPPEPRGTLFMFADLRHDVRYAMRMLAAAPAFTFVVLLTLTLGVGATAVIFTAVDAILLRSPAIADPSSLASVYVATTDGRSRFGTFSFPDYADLRDSRVFRDAAAFGSIMLALDTGEQTETVNGEIVTGNYFDVLGTRLVRGRPFLPEEDRRGTASRAAVISHAFWQNRLGAAADVVGRSIALNGHLFTIVGITPPPFTGPIVGRAPEVWLPVALQPYVRPPTAGLRRALGTSDLLAERGPSWLNVVVRRQPGVSVGQASAGLNVLARRLQSAYPDTNRLRTFSVVPLGEGPGVRASTRPRLRLLSASVLLVLLIACANVTSLLLARSVSRRREIAVRMAMGAGIARLVRQWLTESVLLALLGGVGGLLLAKWGVPLLYVAGIPETIALGVNLRVLAFTFAMAAASGIMFGLAPIIQVLRGDTISALRGEGGGVATGLGAARLRRAFVVFQVAVSLVLLVGAGLFLRTLRNASAVELGYGLDSTMVADINLDVRGYSQTAGRAVYAQIIDRLNQTPGVAAAGAARVTVLSGGARPTVVSLDRRPITRDSGNALEVRVNVVSHGYLDALGIPLLRGRDFTTADTATTMRVAIVSRSLAARMWPRQDPIGKILSDGSSSDSGSATVVGMVPDTVYLHPLEREPPPFFYVPLSQNHEGGVALHIRSEHGDPLALLPAVRAAVRGVDPGIVVARPQRLRAVFEQSISEQRMMALLVGLFGAVALVLAAVGIYGVMAHLAGQRRTEIGIRLALGARPASVFGLILGEGLRLVGIGAALGLAGAFTATRYIEGELFGVPPADPLTFGAVCVLLTAVAAFACLIPARRAMRVDPAVTLRST